MGGKWGDNPNGGNYRYGLKHRLQSYKQKDDPKEHPTKVALRPDIAITIQRKYGIRRKGVPPKNVGRREISITIKKETVIVTK